MKFELPLFRLHPAPEAHEAALLDAAAGLTLAATAWRRGTTTVLDEPRRFLRAIERHLTALNVYAKRNRANR